jgi:hypothetical protein
MFSHELVQVELESLERYGQLAAKQIIPHLGAAKLQKLKPEHVQAWHRTLLDSGLSPRTIGSRYHRRSLLAATLCQRTHRGQAEGPKVLAPELAPNIEGQDVTGSDETTAQAL